MKNLFYNCLFASAILVSAASCNKVEVPEPTVPNPVDTTKPSTGAPSFTPSIADINGSLVAIQTKTTVTQAGFSVDTKTETAVATFYNGSTMVDAGTVSVNDFNLEKQTNNSYLKTPSATSTTTDLKYSTGTKWVVAGNSANNVPAISVYQHGNNFPEYTGTVPTSITKASGLTFTFDATNVKNADSVYVFVATSNGTTFMKAFGATAGTVNITASELSNLPVVSDNTAYLEVIPVTYAVKTFGGKQYAFIKEQACVKNVNIN